MKISISIIIIVLFVLGAFLPHKAISQSPNKISYQSVVRNASGDLITESLIGLQISILQGSTMGLAVYVETHSTTTNVNGLASLEIGAGSIVLGTFGDINWSNGPYYIKTEVDPNGGSSYSISATTELLSVPYALHSKTSDDNQWFENGSGINTWNNRVGINSGNPLHTLDVRSLSQADAAGLNISNDDRSRYVRFFSGSDMFPDPSMSWAPGQSLLFATFDDNTFDFQEKMRISSLGNVGIGEINPTQKLDVNGKIKLADDDNDAEPGTMRFNSVNDSFEGFNGVEWVAMDYKPIVYSYEQHGVTESFSSTIRDSLVSFPYDLTIEKPGKYMCFFDLTFSSLFGNTTTLSSDRSVYIELQVFNQLEFEFIGPNQTGLPSGFTYYFRNFEKIQSHRIIEITNPNQKMHFRYRVNSNSCCSAYTSPYSIIDVKMTATKID